MAVSSRDVLARLDRRVPAAAAAGLESAGATAPAHPNPATSVVLLRDSGRDTEAGGGPGADPGGGVQTYVLHRHSRMPFAAGMVVFPGGCWDPVDGVPQPALGLADPTRLSCGVRETLEETGVRLRPDDLHPWAHWITPEYEPRRYDTAFYLAALPSGEQAADISGEAWKAEWRTPAQLLAAADHGELSLMPPTRSILLELAALPTVAAALAATADRRVETVRPRVVRGPDGWLFEYEPPGDPSDPGRDDPVGPVR
jgi:8-oxo-dGTP pyrophosphatase MutT (NUDIX family)